MLAMEVEFLSGVCFAAEATDRARAEWPPQPDRLFSAFVAAWGEGGEDPMQQTALEWLERLPAPVVCASDAVRRDTVTVYVPPNDARVTGAISAPATVPMIRDQLTILPDRRRRQARRFPAAIPERRSVEYCWPDNAATEPTLAALRSIASRIAYLGHSASLTRIAVFNDGEIEDAIAHYPDPSGGQSLRWVYPGRLAELASGYRAASRQGAIWRPRPGITYAYREPGECASPSARHSVFGREWLILEDAGGNAPLLTAFPKVAKTLHRTLVEICTAKLGRTAPEVLTGTRADGSPSDAPHLAIVPMADVGWRFSGGRLMGLAVVLPRSVERRWDDPEIVTVQETVAELMRNRDVGITLGRHGIWTLARSTATEKASLRPDRYLRPACRWASVTPVVLDRFPKQRMGETDVELLARACEHVGLPRPVSISTGISSPFLGAAPTRPPNGNPRWTDWAFPEGSPLATRPRRHVTLEFAAPVEGPLLLGAGRYHGLGLCLPLDGTHDHTAPH
jgi:CRISPR-associated protein Csb2